MELNNFFQVSVSVFCVVATVFMIMTMVWLTMLGVQFNKMIAMLEQILEIARTTSEDVKKFVERTIDSLEAFKNSIFTFESIRRVVTEIIKMIKNNAKGAKDGKEE